MLIATEQIGIARTCFIIISHNRGNQDGQMQTTYGNLSAFSVPYIVVPASFVKKHNIPANAISAVLCGGNVYYAIMGDTNGDTPEVIGEASYLVGQTCFPNDGLNGAIGHVPGDVLCTGLT
jgi:chitosanase